MAQQIKQARPGDRVKINFVGTLSDGSVFDSTYEEDCGEEGCGCESGPMELELGAEEFFPEVEEALVGLAVGDKVAVAIPAEEAFGEYDSELVFTVPRSQFPPDVVPEVGDDLELLDDEGEGMVVTVIEMTESDVTLDANHPLAGEDLCFEVELVEVL